MREEWRMTPEQGSDMFFMIFNNTYPVSIHESLVQRRQVDEKRENLHSHTKCVRFMEEGGVGKEGGVFL